MTTMDLSRVVWHKSRRSTQNGSCVEVAAVHGSKERPDSMVAVRDSKDRRGSVLVFTPDEWRTFTAGVLDGEFDLS